jgi:hypothetical protein
MNAPRPLRSNFYCPSTLDADAIKRHGYIDQGVLVLNVDDHRLDFLEREVLRRIGDRLYRNPRVAK